MADTKKIRKIRSKDLATDLVHRARRLKGKNSKGTYEDPTGAVTPAIYATSTFKYSNQAGYDYTRSGNPNFEMLSQTLAALENSEFCTVFSSGMSAITAVLQSLKSGDIIVLEENVYGCTYRIIEQVYKKFGIQSYYLDLSNPENYEKILELKPTYVWLESPTNPLLKIVDIAAVSKYAHQVDAKVLVDNTFATGALQRPLDLGADLSLLSTTKYVMGHSVCLGGAVCSNDPELNEMLIFQQKACGLQPSPFDAWLTQLGANTLDLRMAKHSANAFEIATWFETETSVVSVRYPFSKSHPQYELAKRQMLSGSGLIAVDLGLSKEETIEFLAKLKYFTLAESLGGVESLVCHPASMTHAAVPAEVRNKVGITDSLVRFSVGIEGVKDLISDLKQALPAKLLQRSATSTVANS